MSHLLTFAAEPATIVYITTGAAGFTYAAVRKSSDRIKSSVPMLFCRRASRRVLRSLDLL